MGRIRADQRADPMALGQGLMALFAGKDTDEAECAAVHFATWMIQSRRKITGEKT